MSLVDRYLHAVRDNLPRGQQDDIINELADSLQSRFEDDEAVRGRPLTEDEEVAILRALGHPMVVAARDRGDERSVRSGGRLIEPELFHRSHGPSPSTSRSPGDRRRDRSLIGRSVWSAIVGHPDPDGIQFSIVTCVFVGSTGGGYGTRRAGTRGRSPRWGRTSTCRPSMASRVQLIGKPLTRAVCDHDVGGRDRPAGDRADGLARDRVARPDRASSSPVLVGSTCGLRQPSSSPSRWRFRS